MTPAADCNNVRTSFPVAVMYSVVVETTVPDFLDNF